MKTVKITVTQEAKGFEFTNNYKGLNEDKAERSQIIGTSLKALFDLIELRNKTGFKGISLALPFDLTVETDGLKVTTVDLDSFLRARLKLGNSPKSKRKFAQVYCAIVDHVMADKCISTIEEELAKLPE
jgi:hypothetical protein